MAIIVPAQQTTIANLYTALFNRAPDATGFGFWVQALSNGASLSTITQGFLSSPESKAIYPSSQTSEQFIATFYSSVLGRTVPTTDAGVIFWAGVVNANGGSSSDAARTIAVSEIIKVVSTPLTTKPTDITDAQYAQTVADRSTFINKGLVGVYYAVEAKGTSTDIAKSVLAGVNATDASVTAAKLVADGTAGGGTTFALTVSADAIVGTSGSDTIGGTNDGTTTQFSAVDSIDGGAGIDTLKLQLGAAGYAGGAVIKNIEKIQVTGTAATAFDANGITGLTDLISIGGAGTTAFNNVGSLVNFLVQANGANAQTLQFANAAVAGAADAMTLTLNGAQNTINVNSVTADASGVETINIVTTGNDSTTAVTLASNDTSVTKLAITGDKALTLVAGTNITTTATTIDASAFTGKLTLSGLGVANHTVTGGTNDDLVNFGANLTSADVFNGGTGVDTLAANGAQLAAITTVDANITNIETLMLADDVDAAATAINAANFGTINNFRVVDQAATGAAAVTVNNLAAATTGTNNIRFDGDLGGNGGSFTFNIAKATDPGTANAVTLDMRGGATTATSAIVAQGVETVTIDTTNATGLKTFNLTDASLASLTVKGVQGVTLSGAALGGNVSAIDASGLTGAAGLNVSLNTGATTGANITGSGLADTVTGSNLRDIVNLGAGADTFIFSGGNDTVTLGAGADIVRINTIATSTSATGANVVSITDFVAGTDKINFARGNAALTGVTTDGTDDAVAAMNAALTNTTSVATIADVYTQLGTQLTAGAFAASAADGTATVAQVVVFSAGAAAGTYLVVNNATAGFTAATDVVINITGVSGTLSAADFTFNV